MGLVPYEQITNTVCAKSEWRQVGQVVGDLPPKPSIGLLKANKQTNHSFIFSDRQTSTTIYLGIVIMLLNYLFIYYFFFAVVVKCSCCCVLVIFIFL